MAEGRYQDAIEEVRNRQAIIAQRRSELDLARQQLTDTVILSPIDGAVSLKQASVGEYLHAGAPIATLVRVHPLRLRVPVPEREGAGVRVGHAVTLTVEGDPTVYRGRVVRLVADRAGAEPHADGRGRGAERARLPAARLLRARRHHDRGEPAGGDGAGQRHHRVRGRREGAASSEQGKTAEVRVTTGRRLGEDVEIVDGLKRGEAVVDQARQPHRRPARHGGPVARMQKLAEVCIKRPVFATMLIMAFVVIGAASWFRLGVDRFPAVDLPTVSVRVELPGASTEEIETQVAQKLEEQINTIQGIQELRSISGPGSAVVIVTFNLNRQIDVAAQDVRDKVAIAIRNLPREILPPIVSKFDNDQAPVVTIALSGDRSLRELTEIADKIVRPQLERSAGVGEVRIVGGLLARHQRLGRSRPAGRLPDPDHDRARRARAPERRPARRQRDGRAQRGVAADDGPHRRARAFNDLVVATLDGVPVRVRDIGYAEDGTKEQRSAARLNGVPTVIMEVRRQSGENTVAVIEGVKAKLTRLRRPGPARRHARGDPRPVALHLRGAARDQPAPGAGLDPRLAGGARLHALVALDVHRRGGHPDLGRSRRSG